MGDHRTAFLHLDSAFRPSASSTPPNGYRFVLPRVLRRVREVEVFRAEIPSTMYNVPAGRNSVALTIRLAQLNLPFTYFLVVLTIPPGSYTYTTAVAALNVAKNANATFIAQGWGALTSFSSSASTGKLAFASTVVHLTAKFDAVAYELGIDRLTTEYYQAIEGDSPFRLNSATSVFLSIPELAHSSDILIHHDTPNIKTADIVARFQLTAEAFGMNYITSENRIYLRRYPAHALANLTALTILFHDISGELVDFNGADHRLFLRVVHEGE
jgi:hypothetical protein